MSERIPFVCTVAQREAYDGVSAEQGVDRSEWIRSVLDREVERLKKKRK